MAGAALVAYAPVAHAQSQDTVEVSDVSEIVVTGQRQADRNAIKAKRDAVQIVDAVSADDIGQIADFSVGDALKRISGVNVYTYQGEPRFASIRGFNSNYITTTLEGFQIASPDSINQNNGGGRQFYLETLPSNIASRIEVYKTSTPDMDGHSMGGSVNFAVPSALDFNKDQLNITLRGGPQLIAKKYGGVRPTGEGEVLLTRRFGAERQFGLTVSASYWRREQWIPQAEQGSTDFWYQPTGVNSGRAYVGAGPVGSERRWMTYDNNRERKSVLARFDWRPDGKWSSNLIGYYFGQNEKAFRNDTIATIGSSAVVSNQTATSGTISPRAGAAFSTDVSQNVRLYKLYFDRKIYGGQFHTQYTVSDELKISGGAAYSRALFNNPQISDYFVQNGLAFNYQKVGGADRDAGVLFTPVDPINYNNAALYIGGNTAANPQHLEERYKTSAQHYESKLKAAYRMAPDDLGFGAETGLSAIRNEHREAYAKTYQMGMPYTLADVLSNDSLCALYCTDRGLFVIDDAKLQPLLSRYLSAVPKSTDLAQGFGRTFGVREDVNAAYATLRWKAEAWSVLGGLRYETTDFRTTGYQAVTARTGGVSSTTYKPSAAKSDYGHWLPSVTAAYDLTPSMRLRAAYSRTIGRPKFTDMAMLGGALNTVDPANPILTIGNPQLKPRESDNFDLSFEWYIDDSQGLVSASLFHKTVKNEIYLLGRSAPIDVGGGVMVQGTMTSPVNSADTTEVDGMEFNLIKYLNFLPGPLSHFGVSANGVVMNTRFPIRLQDGTRVKLKSLPNQAKNTVNLAVFYETSRFHARATWNRTDSLIEERQLASGTTSAANFYRVRYTLPATIIDASASYDLTPRWTVRVDATNLTGRGVDTNIGVNQEIPVARMKVPTALLFGVSARF